ncbi:UvrD-helicase domain-containing protein [Microvirga sp. STS02]|uniref:UvrD-helicase domain-containing protein n=1 Tax=Hymenobacter negativus TaxID=2795026 RepID=UPI0018DC7536|nr:MULTISPECIES: UvrD-helicase domain-containing protein [Bacteria]MBH8569609.1 UvrD-helicase domain-containing protein [Hymenobacter negativus]MBR7209345.1 UvrD-helicase domain-containing protein [Microvirga sp. STS02]
MPPSFRIYSSSAGSGKTYQLTKEYLLLALGSDSPEYFKHVLAITFTNDAAGEMKHRIVDALRDFAYPKEGKTDTLLADIAAELKLPETEVRRRAAETFRLVLYHYADFGVSTIDSFVQRIVTAFTRELGLPATFEVELDTDAVLQSAVAALLDKVNRDPNSKLLSQTLAEYALGQADEGKSWSRLPEELAGFGKVLFNETVQEAVAQLDRLSLADFRRLDKEIRARRAEIEADFVKTKEAAVAVLEQAGATEGDFFQGKRGIFGYVQKGLDLLAPEAGPNSYVNATLADDKWYSGKIKTEADRARVDETKESLRSIVAAVAQLREVHLQSYTLLAAMQPYLFHASLLSELNKIVEQISRERNVVLISEFNRRIASIVLTEPVPFLYERLGEKYEHILIDEFQDTSVLQWNNLLPLVENTLANGHSSLAVGDAKQAIYRWRGGEMEQILRLHQGNTEALAARAREPEMRELLRGRYEAFRGKLEPKALQVNYRSAREIVDFNNSFFEAVSARHEALGLVTGIYDAHFGQQVPESQRAGQQGHVELLFTQKDAPALIFDPATGTYTAEPLPGHAPEALLGYDESTCYLTLQLVEQALRDGYEIQDISVLCRTRYASKIIAKFLKERGYAIISADSLALEFAEVVNLLVSILRVLHQPADTLARAEALLLVDKVVRGLAPTPARARHIATVANAAGGTSFFDELRALGYDVQEHETGNLGLYELAERLLSLFGLLGRNGESEYLFRFLDLTLEYSLKFGNNLGNFLTHWEERKGRISINAPGGRAAITITTVHKAKGLAYGVVIVPFADWSLEPHRGTLLWGHLEAGEKPIELMPDVAVVSLSKGIQQTVMGTQYDEEREKTFLEGLNTLYVAFTRPRYRLYVISKRPDEKKTTKTDELDAAPAAAARTVADLLLGYLQSRGQWQEEQVSFIISQGTPAAKARTPNEELRAQNYELTNLAAAPWEERLKLRRHATTLFDFDEQKAQGEWNRKLHFALRRLLTAADVGRVASQLVAEGILSAKERPALVESLETLVSDPRLAPYFAPHLSVETEREILVGGVKLRDYKPDRVVLEPSLEAYHRLGGRVTLMDFRLPPPQEKHKRLLRNYATLFEQLGYAEVRGVIYYFGTGEVVEV